MSDKKKSGSFFADVKAHWNEPDRAAGKHVPYKEYLSVFFGVSMNYGVQVPLKYISWGASCFLIMYHYNLPYLAFSVIALIGLPLSYLWNILSWVVNDNLGLLEKKKEVKFLTFYGAVAAVGLTMILFDTHSIFPAGLVSLLDSINGVSAKSFFKIFGIQLFSNAYGGIRNLLWKKKLIPKYGRYKYILFANYFQKCLVILAMGWLPVYKVGNVDDRMWMAYLLFSIWNCYEFANVIEDCTSSISPNNDERMMIRTWPVKLAHLLNNVFDLIIPLFGIGFDDIRFFKYVLPAVFIPMGAVTLFATRSIHERIPQPPLEKKQRVSFWYGVSQVMKNKYKWINTLSTLLDSLGNGAIDLKNVIYFFSMRLYTQGILYGVMKLLNNFRSTPLSFVAPHFVKKFSFRSLRIFQMAMNIVCRAGEILVTWLFPERQTLCGIVIFTCEFICGFLGSVSEVAQKDMDVRLKDYQMYLSGERLESSSGVFNWIISPVTTLVGLIIPVLILKSGFNSNWDVLFIDSARFGIVAVPLLFDMAGFICMLIPYVFWDYNNEQHRYVMEVLKQREKLAEEGWFPEEYEGGLNFMEPGELHTKIPVNSEALLEKRDAAVYAAAEEG